MATQATTPAATVIQTQAAVNKASIARNIYNEKASTEPRKVVIALFQSEAHLTPKGAATYYQNFKKAAGLVKERGPIAAQPTTTTK